MAPTMHLRSTVDRLDRPSSYTIGKVRHSCFPFLTKTLDHKLNIDQKKRKYVRAPEDTREPSPEIEDKLKDATTLYVGNLYASLTNITCLL